MASNLVPTRVGAWHGLAAALIGLCLFGSLLAPADAGFECRIKKSIRSEASSVGQSYTAHTGTAYTSALHVYMAVASTSCADDAAMLSGRAATSSALECSEQTNLPASTHTSSNFAQYRTIQPAVTLTPATLGTNLVDESFFCFGSSFAAGYHYAYTSTSDCSSAPTALPALLAPVNTSCATTAAHLNGMIGNGVDFYCDGYIGFLQLRNCPDKIGVLNDFIAGVSTRAPTAAPTTAPTVAPTNCDAVRVDGEHFDSNSREFCEAAFAGGHCDSPSVFASCNFTCTGCTAAPTTSPTVAAAPTSAPTSSIEGLVASVATLMSQVATLNSTLIATRADLARVRACNDAGQLYSSSTDTCTSQSSGSSGSSGPPGPPGPPGPHTIPTDTADTIASLETTLARVAACNTAGQLYNSDTDTCADPPQSSGTTECLRPACGQGTQVQDGECIPDCEDLRRRSLDCHPFCDGPDGLATRAISTNQTTATVGTEPQADIPLTNMTSDSFQSTSSTPGWALAVGIAAVVLLMCFIAAVVMFLRERLTNKHRRNAPSAFQNPAYDAPPLGDDPCAPVTTMTNELYVAGSPIYAAVDDAATNSTA